MLPRKTPTEELKQKYVVLTLNCIFVGIFLNQPAGGCIQQNQFPIHAA
jgi:hypothetical protein